MNVIENIDSLAKMGAKAVKMKDTISKKSVASAARDSIFQFPCLVAGSVPINMATGTVRLLDRNYAAFVQILMSQIANVDISVDRTPIQFLKRVHQNMKLESVEEEEDFRIIKERFYDGDLVVAMNESTGVAIAFEPSDKSNSLIKLNLEASREFLSEFDLQPFIEADVTKDDLMNALVTSSQNKASRERQLLASKIGAGVKAPSLMDRDVKKLNDMQPYALQVRLNVINENNEFVEYWDIVVGVKTVLHLIKSEEIIDNIVRVANNQNPIFNFIRWTTGEISLIKDIMLKIDDVKFDMRNRQSGHSAWFPTLKRMKERKFNLNGRGLNQLVPNSSLVITSYEADILERNHGILIKDTKVASRLIDNLFLMAFIILDEGTETVEVMYDHTDRFETYALETIQREVALNSNKLASEIGRMIGSNR